MSAIASPTSDLRPTEEVVLYSSYAFPSAEGHSWTVRLRGAVFEPQRSVLKRAALNAIAGRAMKFSIAEFRSAIFQERFGFFVVRWRGGRKVAIGLGASGATAVATTRTDGHFHTELELSGDVVERLFAEQRSHDGWVAVHVLLPPDDDRRFTGQIQFLSSDGVSIVSDIDDTIKASCVHDRRELLANTFLRPFQPVAGMARLYQRCCAKGVAFHYVSGSPWQLYAPLCEFFRQEELPPGSFDLKYHELGRKSSLDDFDAQYEEKLKVVGPLLAAFPRRRFLLIGDSGQQDPEIYARLAVTHPEQIAAIFIRNVSGDPGETDRVRALLADRNAPQWMVFARPEDLEAPLARLIEHFAHYGTDTSQQSAMLPKSY